jgi:hypothetical protein
MKILKVFAVCLTILTTQFSFSNSPAKSDNLSSEQNTAQNYTQYEEIDGHIYLVTYSDDGKVIDTVLVD